MKHSNKIINPSFLKIDDRSISDLINYANNISKEIILHDNENIPNSFLFDMFSNDETFLISEILMFDISSLKSDQIKYIKKHDSGNNIKISVNNLLDYVEFNFHFFKTINDWYNRSFNKRVQINDNDLNFIIESIIKSYASKLFNDYNYIIELINNKSLTKRSLDKKKLDSSYSIWDSSLSSLNNEFDLNRSSKSMIDFLFKRLILINNDLFKLLLSIIKFSEKQFKSTLKVDDHNPHIGLLFSFLHLFKHLQNDINKISQKHLDFYFQKILSQKQLKTLPNKTFAVISIDQNIDEVLVNKIERINSGQYKDGSIIKYELDNDVNLNNAKITFLMTIYLSLNQYIDFQSRYKLIDSVYSRKICSDNTEFLKFNKSDSVFNALGHDQNFISRSELTMNYSEIGFILGSSSFRLGKSRREIIIDFIFEEASFRQLVDLLVDISNNSSLGEDEVFFRVFSNSFNIFYTTEVGWSKIENYEFIVPQDWSKNKLSLSIELSKSDEAFFDFNIENHNLKIESDTPLIKFLVNQDKFYNSFAFLNGIKLEKISIKAKLFDLKEIKIYKDGQNIQNSNEFDMFGPIPKKNSKLFIGCEQIFNKNITNFKLNWHYTNLDEINYNLSKYYDRYGLDFSSKLFKLKISLLSDFNYLNRDDENFKFLMFDEEDNKLSTSKSHKFLSLDKTGVTPNYKINNNYLKEFSNDYETGLIKVELDSPLHCFGHRIYPKIYASNISKNISKKEVDISNNFINEPFSPKISEISIDYSSESILYFNEKNRNENNFDENNSFFHISPYGINQTFSNNYINNKMFYDLSNEGELIIGFECLNKFKNLDLFFEIIKNENDNYNFSSKIEWSYKANNEWKLLNNQNILSDQTNNLLNSGVISFLFPNDFNSNSKGLKENTYFLKASSKNRADQFGLIKSMHTNAVSVTEVIPENESLRLNQLKAESFQNLENNIKGVISIYQPIDSPKISLSEDKIQFYNRVSNLLKHKNRPVTKSDFEKFILNNFNYLSYVKCVENNKSGLSLICLKKIHKRQHIDEIKLSSSEVKQISSFLKKFTSPFFKIKIINPVFEDMWIKCSIKFKELNPGRAIDQLNQDILDFICPWKNNNSIDSIPKKVNNIDLRNFIKEKFYVEYITGFSVIHLRKNSKGNIKLYDSAKENYDNDFIRSGTEKSLIIPRNNHIIKILDSIEYEKPEPININDFKIEESFYTQVDNNNTTKNKAVNKEEGDYDNLRFILN